jgi:hypothetical protein
MPQFGRSHDDSIYFVSAKSIAQGHGYRILSLPGEPYQTKYPPLFPLLLTLVWKIKPEFPGNLQLAGLLCWLMLPAFLAVSWIFYKRQGLAQWQCLSLVALLGLNFVVVEFSLDVMPELMFLSLLIASVLLADRATDNSNSWEALAAALLRRPPILRSRPRFHFYSRRLCCC